MELIADRTTPLREGADRREVGGWVQIPHPIHSVLGRKGRLPEEIFSLMDAPEQVAPEKL